MTELALQRVQRDDPNIGTTTWMRTATPGPDLARRVQALRERLERSDWILCAEALRILDGKEGSRRPGYVGFPDMRQPPSRGRSDV